MDYQDCLYMTMGIKKVVFFSFNARTINQFIHPDVLETCQLSMGLTWLELGSGVSEEI